LSWREHGHLGTVRKISVGASNLSAQFSNEIPSPERRLFVNHIKYEQSASGEAQMSQADVGSDPVRS
jgi:hypothetical protein